MKRLICAALGVAALAGTAHTVDLTDAQAQDRNRGAQQFQAPTKVPTEMQVTPGALDNISPLLTCGPGYQLIGTPQFFPPNSDWHLHVSEFKCVAMGFQKCPKPVRSGLEVKVELIHQSAAQGQFRINYKCIYDHIEG